MKIETNKIDNVNNPKHYANGCSIECIDTMEMVFGADNLITFCTMNAYKYVWRYRNKNGIEDLRKAKWYLDKILEIENIALGSPVMRIKADKLRQLVEKGLKEYENK